MNEQSPINGTMQQVALWVRSLFLALDEIETRLADICDKLDELTPARENWWDG